MRISSSIGSGSDRRSLGSLDIRPEESPRQWALSAAAAQAAISTYGCSATASFRLQSLNRGLEFNHGLRSVPHAFKVCFELHGGCGVADDDQVVVLRLLAARAEVRRARAQKIAVDLVSLEMHERAAALAPDVVGEV